MSETATHETEHHDHHGSAMTYWAVFVSLCVLTTLSFLTTMSWWPFGMAMTRILMMIVSCAKALLVIMFFMHLKWETNWKWVMTIPASIMAVFLMLMLIPDVGWRTSRYEEDRQIRAARTPDPEKGETYPQRHAEDLHGAAHSDAAH
jgi:cytochrome c oxidase subunit 4